MNSTIFSINLNITDLAFGKTGFHYACQNGHLETVLLLLESSVDFDIDVSANPYSGTVLHLACSNGHSNVAEVILKNSKTIKIDFNARLMINFSEFSV